MTDNGKNKKPAAGARGDESPSQSTDTFKPLASAQSTFVEEEVGKSESPTDPPLPALPSAQQKTLVGLTPETKHPVTTALPQALNKTLVERRNSKGEVPITSPEHPVPKGASKKALPAVPPKSSKSGLPQVGPRAPLHSKSGLPQVGPPLHSKSGLPQVGAPKGPTLSKSGMPAVKHPPVTKEAVVHSPEVPTSPLNKKVAESPTLLRPALGGQEAIPTGELQIPEAPDNATRLRPGLGDSVPPADTDSQSGPRPGALREDPALSTLGYRSLQKRGVVGRLLDPKTRFVLLAAVGGTFALLLLVWGLTAPKARAPDPRALRPVPRPAVVEVPVVQPVAVEAPKKEAGIFIDEVLDAGSGLTRTVRVEAGTITIITTPETVVSRGAQELGRTPLTVTLPVGKIPLQLANKSMGFSRAVTVDVGPGVNTARLFEFARGYLEVRAPPGTQVAIDGRAQGKTPLAPVGLWAGIHTIDVAFPRGGKDSRKIEVESGFTKPVDFEAPVPEQETR